MTRTEAYYQPPAVSTIEQKPADRFQNYSEILQRFDARQPENPKRQGFEGENYQRFEAAGNEKYEYQKAPGIEERQAGYYAEMKPNEYRQGSELKPRNEFSYELKPRSEHSEDRNEQVKRSAFEPAQRQFEQKLPFQSFEAKHEVKPVYGNDMAEFNSDVNQNFSRPSDMNAPMNPQRISEQGQQQQHKPMSLYDNVSFANEFFESKTQQQEHQDLKKKSSISEMKRSINNPGNDIFVLMGSTLKLIYF